MLIAGGVVALLMRIWGGSLFGAAPTDGAYNITWPLVGYFEVPSLVGFVVAGSALVTLAMGLRSRRPSWVASGLLVLMFAAPIHFTGGINTVRAAGVLPVVWALDPPPVAKKPARTAKRRRDPSVTDPSSNI